MQSPASVSHDGEKQGDSVPSPLHEPQVRTADPLAPPVAEQDDDDIPMVVVPEADVVAVQVDTLETVTVRAPSNLHAGFRLQVDDTMSGRSLWVEVPAGGVRAGEQFQGIIILTDEDRSPRPPAGHVPIGAWRDGVLDCCKFGLFHPLICLGFWAPPLALGQVMTRLGLNACGEDETEKKPRCSAFQVMCVLFAVSTCTSVVFGQLIEDVVFEDEDNDGEPDSEKDQGWFFGVRLTRLAISFFYYVFIFIVAIRTRAFVRKKYKIRPRCCWECEDLCCALGCYCCMVCQLARHTADYERQTVKCCTQTGLSRDAPMPV